MLPPPSSVLFRITPPSCVAGITDKDDPSAGYAYTPLWVAPEVMLGRYNAKVDIWSIGCVVIELATAAEPWAERRFDSSFAALYFIATHKGEVPRVPDGLSEVGKDFVRRCCRRDVDARPTAGELLQHAFVVEEWAEVEVGVVKRGEQGGGGPPPSRVGMEEVVQASMQQTRSTQEGTATAGMMEVQSSGEYQPMQSHTFSPSRPLQWSGEAEAMDVQEESQANSSSNSSSAAGMQAAAMTCPLP